MITNFETNKTYIAEGLSAPAHHRAADSLVSSFESHHVEWEQIPCTSSPLHIWARDYMPVQVSETKFVRFDYSPD